MGNRISLITILLLTLDASVHAGEATITLPNSTSQTSLPTVPLDPNALADALRESNQFLALLTGGKFSQCYDLLEPLAKAQLSKEQWVKEATTLLSPLGARQSAEFKIAIASETMPGAPPGHYISIGLLTTFARGRVGETITLLNRTGRWQVIGYHFQKAMQGAT